jgi:lysozyme family protein
MAIADSFSLAGTSEAFDSVGWGSKTQWGFVKRLSGEEYAGNLEASARPSTIGGIMAADGFESALAFVLRWEGGYVDNKADPGGATNKGVTQAVYDAWRRQSGIATQDVRLLGDAELRSIYQGGYWTPARCDGLKERLDLVEFDTSVNMGVHRAIRFLQSAVGCDVDGNFGPGTQRAVDAADAGLTLAAYCDAREQYYRELVKKNADLGAFLKGWLNRLNSLRHQVGLPVVEALEPLDPGAVEAPPRIPDFGEDPKFDWQSRDASRSEARITLQRLRSVDAARHLPAAKRLVEELRNFRELELMGELAEAVSRLDGKDARNRRLYGQYLIETGKATAAIDVLQPLVKRLRPQDPEYAEAAGLLGRANKQIFFDAADRSSASAQLALKNAVAAYRKPYDLDSANTWHGVNLLALLYNCKRLGLRVAPDLEVQTLANKVIAALEAVPAEKRDPWRLATLSEAVLALGNWEKVEETLREYLGAPDVQAFHLNSTLRQFTEIWGLESASEEGRKLVDLLRARLLKMPGGNLQLSADEVRRLRSAPPITPRLEALLGIEGPRNYQWWKTGLDRAASVASVRRRLGGRVGTGFLVRAQDLGLQQTAELLLLTNFHVINENGVSPAIRPRDAEVVFESVDAGRVYGVNRIVWSSGVDQCDACAVELSTPVAGITPMPVDADLPSLEAKPRVYIIGHPGGRDLAFSFQDNEMLDHEGPPQGHPQIPGVCRVHYRAPTEGGSSGSPVFNDSWEVIALHHKGGQIGMPRLNGLPGSYAANEGIAIQSLMAASKA